MRKKSALAAVVTSAALSVGFMAPASSQAAGGLSLGGLDLSAVCNGLGLKPVLNILNINLAPIVRIKATDLCGG